uniref:Uncharacterized protein n=1 Tax=Noctiluca scintillans TaxID=2966 RepID=A0A7S1F1E4_NOCSC|mmetsp:Transcript_25865/g.67824  ORF Transcript_25865/g.67824 Transcript_25865/m.67824 type:complete len:484 (+) Transcript_25865:64-1515(+)
MKLMLGGVLLALLRPVLCDPLKIKRHSNTTDDADIVSVARSKSRLLALSKALHEERRKQKRIQRALQEKRGKTKSLHVEEMEERGQFQHLESELSELKQKGSMKNTQFEDQVSNLTRSAKLWQEKNTGQQWREAAAVFQGNEAERKEAALKLKEQVIQKKLAALRRLILNADHDASKTDSDKHSDVELSKDDDTAEEVAFSGAKHTPPNRTAPSQRIVSPEEKETKLATKPTVNVKTDPETTSAQQSREELGSGVGDHQPRVVNSDDGLDFIGEDELLAGIAGEAPANATVPTQKVSSHMRKREFLVEKRIAAHVSAQPTSSISTLAPSKHQSEHKPGSTHEQNVVAMHHKTTGAKSVVSEAVTKRTKPVIEAKETSHRDVVAAPKSKANTKVVLAQGRDDSDARKTPLQVVGEFQDLDAQLEQESKQAEDLSDAQHLMQGLGVKDSALQSPVHEKQRANETLLDTTSEDDAELMLGSSPLLA